MGFGCGRPLLFVVVVGLVLGQFWVLAVGLMAVDSWGLVVVVVVALVLGFDGGGFKSIGCGGS